MARGKERPVFPFSAIVGLEKLKLALLLNAVDPRIGGVLIKGPKGSGKTTCVRALADILPNVKVVKGCPFNCSPYDPTNMCEKCRERYLRGEELPVEEHRMRVVNLPLSATEDRLVGSLDVEKAIKHGIEALKPGILAEANQNILYVDEVNLLPDHLADDLLDAAATGWNVVEREGVSVSHPARFILVGSMNPEEGELRPQLLDRFGLSVVVDNVRSAEERVEIVKRNLEFEDDPEGFLKKYEEKQEELRRMIIKARELLPQVEIPPELLRIISETCIRLDVDGVRPDIVIARAARALAALRGKRVVGLEEVLEVAELALAHRTRCYGRKEPASPEEIRKTIMDIVGEARKKAPSGKGEAEGEVEMKKGRGLLWRLLKRGRGEGVAFKKEGEGGDDEEPTGHGGPVPEGAKPSLKGVLKKIASFLKALSSPGLYDFWRYLPRRLDVSAELRKIDGVIRRSCGKRAKSLSEAGRGRVWCWRIPRGAPRAVYLPATIRAAAKRRRRTPIEVDVCDVLEPLCVYKAPATVVFVLDASDSMQLRLQLVRGTIARLYRTFRTHRDKVGLITLRNFEARLLQKPTRNIALIGAGLMRVTFDGLTPLASGISLGLKVLREEVARNPEAIPVLVLVTDGGANVPLGVNLKAYNELPSDERDKMAVEDAIRVIRAAREYGIKVVIVNTNPDFVEGIAVTKELARASGGVLYVVGSESRSLGPAF